METVSNSCYLYCKYGIPSLTLEDIAAVTFLYNYKFKTLSKQPPLYKKIRNKKYDKSLLYVLHGYYHLQYTDYKITVLMCEIALKNDITNIEYVPKRFITYNTCLKIVKLNGYFIKYIAECVPDLITYYLCVIAVRNSVYSFSYIPDEFVTEELCEILLSIRGDLITLIPSHITITERLCKIAITNNGYAIDSIPRHLITNELCEIAIRYYKNDGSIISLLPAEFITEDMCKFSLKYCSLSFEFVIKIAPQYITNEMCEYAVKQNSYNFIHVVNNMRHFVTKEMCKNVLEKHCSYSMYIPCEFL